MKKTLLLAYFTFFITSHENYAQSKTPELVQEKLNNYIINESTEKVYIQTDKPMYTIGEDIWFTGYLVNAINHQKSNKSKVLYAELLNAKDSVVAKKTLYIENISVAGDFKIDENWEAGTYTLRGYTNYMKNDSFNSFFQKEIPIYKIEKDDSDSKITTNSKNTNTDAIKSSTDLELSFYPEGGYLVDNIQTKIAFQVKGGKKDFIGLLEDQDGNIVSPVKTAGLGMGVFMMIPETGKNYFVSTTINNKKITFPLPKSLSKGYVLNLTNAGSSIVLNMSSNLENGLQNTYMTAHQRGILLFDNYESRTLNTNTVKIPTTTLTDGVINFTLFDNEGHPVAERVTYIDNPRDKVNLTINSNKDVFSSREKVTLDLELTNPQGIKEYSFISMAVRNLEAIPYNKKGDNIKSYLLLSSDLRGEIKNPGYFFEVDNDPKRKYLLDLVMMTNGWKRFTWQELLYETKQEQIYQAEEGIYVSGTTYKVDDLETPFPSVVRMSFLGQFIAQTPVQPTDAAGRFQFGPDVYPGAVPAIVEARQEDFLDVSERSRNVSIVLDEKAESPALDKTNTIALNAEEVQDANFLKVNRYIQQIQFDLDQEFEQLQAVELEVKRLNDIEKRKDEMEKRTIYRSPDNHLNRIDLESLDFTPVDIMQALEGNMSVRFDGQNFIWNRNGSVVSIYLDGRQIDADYLRGVLPDEISFIDILTGPERASLPASDGDKDLASIVLYSRKRQNFVRVGDDSIERKPGIVNFSSEGFYIARKFYAPKKVSDFEDLNHKQARTTIHWEPMLRTTDKTSTQVSFFTNDIPADYIIEIEGVSVNGQPVHAIKTFYVE